MPTTVYRSRWRTTRSRLLIAAAVLALILAGYLVGRAQSSDPAVSAPPPPPPSPAESPAGSPAGSAAPSSEPAASAPVAGVDAYGRLEAENAAAVSGIEMEDTADSGGGRNAGWINNGDWLRFDQVNFGDTAPASVQVRLASEATAGGRLEIRLDDPAAAPVATLTTAHTGGWQNWRTEVTDVSPVTGMHTVFVTFGNDRPDDFLNLNWLTFRRE
ncbi:carbohydrate-binding protein [Jidongwangia harbinensis]|uniref:carbohydrate-binding protein n=1 Tax=Jidongwangia harbinensis TaxID=2878561 RepID=UPI001CD9759B|nr:carbohydrate-binding protein [Jidongwangia harbinensis]MCA2216515.1 carbohydrate-binding protein [Jidongwangia harbinensis]